MTPEPTTIGVVLLFVTGLLECGRRWQRDKSDERKAAAALVAEEKHRQWDREDRALKQEQTIQAISGNTDISVKAFAAANNVDIKFQSVEKIVQDVAGLRTEMAVLKGAVEEIRRLVELRLNSTQIPA